jgi:hypothetical protein
MKVSEILPNRIIRSRHGSIYRTIANIHPNKNKKTPGYLIVESTEGKKIEVTWVHNDELFEYVD